MSHLRQSVLARMSGKVGLALLILFVVLAVFGPLLVGPVDEAGEFPAGLTPSADHPFGTDARGRDLVNLTVHGARISLVVAVVAGLLTVAVGATVGIASGVVGGRFDSVMMRLTDVFFVIPAIVLAVVLAAIVGPSLTNVILVIAATSWPTTARIIRAETLSLRERQFVMRARAYGASAPWIMRHHVLPNVAGLALANLPLVISTAVFVEATLEFLGLGDPEAVSWGSILEQAYNYGAASLGLWAYVMAPGLCIVGLVLAFTLVSNAAQDSDALERVV